MKTRHLVLVLGDQLWLGNPALADFDPNTDRVLMVEAAGEAAQVWSHKARIAMFFAAMRHFADELVAKRYPIAYLRIGAHPHHSIEAALTDAIATHAPQSVVMCEPGDWRLDQSLRGVCAASGVAIDNRIDTHFLITKTAFVDWSKRYKQLRMELFYRWMRTGNGVLMKDGEPEGGEWNYDSENRASFGKNGPRGIPPARAFLPDAITRAVLADVETHFATHPGSLEHFAWPVTRADALRALDGFIKHGLPDFGRYQDAMWTDEPFLFHSLLGAALNLHLLDPREVIAAAEAAYRAKHAPLAAVEGFIRQILGWREFIRGVYWLDMPSMKAANHFDHEAPLPAWYWTGATHMNCMRQAIGQTLAHGYAHHIQRLMVTGNFAMIAGVSPQAVADWYLAVYVDAIEWVELPNVAGMTLFANGGRFTSKPYAASGAYIKRMSNYCSGCRYKPELKTGSGACPMTTFYWDFLDRHEAEFQSNNRTALMVRNLTRMSKAERDAIRVDAAHKRANLDSL